MRIFMDVHRFAPVAGLEGDMAWISPQFRRWLNMIGFWNRLVKMDTDRLTRKVFAWTYSMHLDGCINWCSEVYSIFLGLNLESCFQLKQTVNINRCKEKLLNRQSENWWNMVHNKPKLGFYALYKDCFTVDNYVKMNLSSSYRSVLAQIRLGILPLPVETWRLNNTKLEDRLCNICNLGKVEDECHFYLNAQPMNPLEIPD